MIEEIRRRNQISLLFRISPSSPGGWPSTAQMASPLSAGPIQLRNHMLGSFAGARCSNCTTRPTRQHLVRCLRRPHASSRSFASNSGKRPRFSQRLGEAMRNTKIQWYQIPVGLGVGFLGLVQFYKVSSREKEKQREALEGVYEDGRRPKRRPRVRPDGPWYDFLSQDNFQSASRC